MRDLDGFGIESLLDPPQELTASREAIRRADGEHQPQRDRRLRQRLHAERLWRLEERP